MNMKVRSLFKRIKGFTLVEIMIVVTIIGILASLAVPAFQRARWKALETSIRNNLRQIWGAAQQYMLENGVDTVLLNQIITWRSKTATEGGKTLHGAAKNPGYTSILQQVADESYDELVLYTTVAPNLNSTAADEAENLLSTSDTQGIPENCSGLGIKTGNDDNLKYIKLAL